MTPQEFAVLSETLRHRSGLILGLDKTYLLESRLKPVLRKYGFADFAALAAAVARADQRVVGDVVDAMTTNETLFFRDVRPFEVFRQTVLPALMTRRAGRRSIRMLCAAASSGQEPYSLAMILKEEAVRLQGWSVEIIAIDISTTVLERARAGVYSQFEVQRGVPTPMLLKYFKREGDTWRIADDIRAMVRYREFNLLDNLAPFGACDVVFCRNVLIYFDRETKARTLDNISRRIPADGYLFLGASETVLGLSDAFVPTAGCGGIYRPADTQPRSLPGALPATTGAQAAVA